MSEPVRYRVALSQPHSHLYELEARFPSHPGDLCVQLPVWTPGSYLVREFARQVQDLRAATESGVALPIQRLDKHRFQIASNGAPVVLRYRVYANELTVRTSHLDGSHGYFNGATVFLYCEALRSRAHHVKVEAPSGWSVFCALDTRNGEQVAGDYDELIDSPFEVGPHTPLEFTAAGVAHQVVIWGEPKPDRTRMVDDLKRVCETEAALFGGLPMERYLFLVYLADKGRGGLEHRASTALLFPRFGFGSNKGWEDFLTLAAHEYFHLWNVKRITPKAFVPMAYDREVYTSLLWAFEGMTSYYDNLLVRRAGLMASSRFLTRLGEAFSSLWCTPGRRIQTLEESSMTAWIKYYRQDENSVNSSVSYYLKGELVAALLDLEIRRRTSDAKSLDDVMRVLWQRYGNGQGVPEPAIEAVASEVAGSDLTAFFDAHLRGTADLDLSSFAHVGLEARMRRRESTSDKGGSAPRVKATEAKPRGWLGASFRGSTVASVIDGSPAYSAGIYAEDEIIACEGFKVDGAALLARCEDRQPGDTVRLTVFRREQLMEIPVTLGSRPNDAIYLARIDNPSAAQQAAFRSWMGQGWEEVA